MVVLAPEGLGEELCSLLAEFRRDALYVLAPAAAPEWDLEAARATFLPADTLAHLHGRLKTIGPADVIVDLLGDRPEDHQDRWSILFLHLRPRGVYVLARPPGGSGADTAAAVQAGRYLQHHWRAEPKASLASGLDAELLDSCARFLVDRSYLLVEKRQRHYLKLRDGEVGRLLPQRNTKDTVRTLHTLGKGELTSRGSVINHESGVPIENMPLVMPYPDLHVQHYTGKLGLIASSLLIADSTILPASYRYPTARGIGNPRITEVGHDFARVADHLRPSRRLSGDYYHLDCWHPGHFGHVMTEVVARLWGWPLAKEEFPDLKAIFRVRHPNERHPALEQFLFTAFGIDRADIVWVDEPVWLSSVVTATPLWQNFTPFYAHPQLADTWQRLRAGAVVHRPESPAKIFVSRRPDLPGRHCRNAAEVEEVFARHGFAIAFPGELDLGEQATLFGNARVVAGFAGSALFNIAYADQLSTLIVVGQESYTARYEHLYTAVLGCTTHYFWSTPDIPHPPGGWSPEAYISAWDFDFGRNGAELEELLASLR